MTDPIIQRIESFQCRRGQLVAERRNRGYTLYRAGSATTLARLPPTGQNERVEVLHWSLWKERWTSAGPLGRTILPIDEPFIRLHAGCHETAEASLPPIGNSLAIARAWQLGCTNFGYG